MCLPQIVLEGQTLHSALLVISLDVAQELCFSNCSQVSSLNVVGSFKLSEYAFFNYIKDFKYICILFDFSLVVCHFTPKEVSCLT